MNYIGLLSIGIIISSRN